MHAGDVEVLQGAGRLDAIVGVGRNGFVAQQIVLEHGGEIAAVSEPGKGATFTVSLPVERPQEAAGDEG